MNFSYCGWLLAIGFYQSRKHSVHSGLALDYYESNYSPRSRRERKELSVLFL